MPKELTHWLIADKALAGLSSASRLRAVIEGHRSAYLGGAVLPDTLLHLFRGPHADTALTLAHSFHNSADNSFAPLIRAESHFPEGLPPALLACLLGVITHMQVDIIFHPFVFALTGTAGIGRHYQIETDIDSYFLHNGTIPASMHRHLADVITPATREPLIHAAALLFDPDGKLPRSALEQALALHCRLQTMYDSTFWTLAITLLALIAGSPFKEQRHLFYPLVRTAAINGFADGAQDWQHPMTGERHHTSLNDLAATALQRSLSLFREIEETGTLAATLHSQSGENLLTGLHGVQQA